MYIFNSFIRRTIMALALLCGSGHLLASPIYHVSVDTSALAGQSGYLDFLVLGLGTATSAQAKLTNFAGDFDTSDFRVGDVAGTRASGVTIGNGSGWNEFAQWAHLGGRFTFDVQFDVDAAIGAGTDLGIALLDGQFGYLGTSANIATFALQPGQPDGVSFDSRFADVNTNTVPEPSTLLQLASGLFLLLGVKRRVRR
jgi:hypothetical protein